MRNIENSRTVLSDEWYAIGGIAKVEAFGSTIIVRDKESGMMQMVLYKMLIGIRISTCLENASTWRLNGSDGE